MRLLRLLRVLFLCSSGIALLGCGDDSGGQSQGVERVEVAALLDGVVFENGELRPGDIPPATSRARLLPTAGDRFSLVPGGPMLLPLGLQDAEEDDVIAATLLQFEGTSSHIRVEEEEPSDMVEVRGMATDDLCAVLCNTLYEIDLFFAAELESGEIGRKSVVELVLDCSEQGREDECSGREPVIDAPDAAAPDGGAPEDGGGAPDGNRPPIAEAGDAVTVDENGAVTLHGQASDPDGEIADSGWTQVEGPAVELAGSGDEVSFTAPFVAAVTNLTFRFTATDDAGDSDFDDVTVTVVPAQSPPVAMAGMSQSADEGATVLLDGASSDSDGSVALGVWEQRAGPAVTLQGSGASVSFVAPLVSVATTLVFAYVVTDDEGLVSEDLVSVTILPLNSAPSANAGSDVAVQEGDAVMLTGSASDADGSVASQQWGQAGGPAVGLAGVDTLTVSFTAPAVSAITSIVLELVVTDDEGALANDLVVVTVNPINLPPTADAGMLQTVAEGTMVQLGGVASDGDGSVASVAWRQLAGTPVTLDDATVLAPSFTAPDVTFPETLRFELTATDDEGATASSLVDVVVTPPASSNLPPMVYAGPDQVVAPGSLVTFAGLESDLDGNVVSRSWAQVSGTAAGAITNADTLAGSFTAPATVCAQSLVFELTVQDDQGAVSTDRVAITVSQGLSGALVLPAVLDLEGGTGGITTGGALWQHGVPSNGPARAHSGSRVWATNLTGNYTDNASEWLCLPPVDRGAAPRATLSLRLWSAAASGDGLRVQALDPEGGWTDVSAVTPAYDGAGQWAAQGYQDEYQLVAAALPSWAGDVVQLRLLFRSSPAGVSVGAYVDDIRVDDEDADPDADGLSGVLAELGAFGTDPFLADSDGDGENDGDEIAGGGDPLVPSRTSATPALQPPLVLDFEADAGGAATNGSLWQRGVPSSGPGVAFSGVNVWATNLGGNYFDNAREYLYLPPVDLTAGGSATLSLRMWINAAVSDGIGIEAWDGSAWVTVPAHSPVYDGTDAIGRPAYLQQRYQNGYVLALASLEAYAGRVLSLRLSQRTSAVAVSTGAYIDDVRVDLESDDPDGDGLPGVIAEREAAGTDPFAADSDGDGENDGAEVAGGGDPLDPARDSSTLLLQAGDHLDFELDDGGLASDGALWSHGTPQSGPGVAFSGSRVWATDLSGNYFDNAREFLYLPPIDLTGAVEPTLSFRLWSRSAAGDGVSLEVLDDVLGWVALDAQSPAYDGTDAIGVPAYATVGYQSEYVLVAASLAPYTGEVVQVRLAFRSGAVAVQAGAFVDDVRLDEEGDDPDADGLSGVLDELLLYGTDPYAADSDGDGDSDGDEDAAGSDPLDPARSSSAPLLSPGARLDFEADAGGLATTGTLWAHGAVASGPGVAHSGTRVWATRLDGNYFDGAREYLYVPPIDLRGGGEATFSLRLWSRAAGNDGVSLEALNPALGWVPLAAQAPAYDGTDAIGLAAYATQGYRSGYVLVAASLADYAGQVVSLRIAFRANGVAVQAGAFIDDIAIDLESGDPDGDGLAGVRGELLAHGTDPFVADSDGDGALDGDEVDAGTDPHNGADYAAGPLWTPGHAESLETDGGGLWSDGSLFQYGPPASGPGVAHTGSRVWATNLGGNYFDGALEYLYLPPLDLSAAASASLGLRLWCANQANDGLSVEVRDDALGWTHLATVAPAYDASDALGLAAYRTQGSGSGAGASYQLVTVDLDSWTGAGNARRSLRLAFRSNGVAVSAGCYLDDMSLD